VGHSTVCKCFKNVPLFGDCALQQRATQGAGHLFGDLFLVDVFFSQIANLTAASQSSLTSQIHDAQDAFIHQQNEEVDVRHTQAEHEAYVVSDPINPQYLYQNCGHY